MKLWVGVTDSDWFRFLRERRPDEVNFWQPSAGRAFRVLAPGELFLFKLHSPQNFIVGGGFFVKHALLPSSLAWKAFGVKNGVEDLRAFHTRIYKYRRSNGFEVDPKIGCIILTAPFFLDDRDWIPVPRDWAPNIVQGKSYDTVSGPGLELWKDVANRCATKREEIEDCAPRYGSDYVTRGRLGQGAFRILVTEAYQRRCAITGERTLPVLEASHIQPFAADGPNRVSNGILLRSDLHILFDRGYVTIRPDRSIEVSKSIREEFENGKEYYAFHGASLRSIPHVREEQPDTEFLQWHNEKVYEKFGSLSSDPI